MTLKPSLSKRYLSDRVQAAAEYDPALAEAAHQWVQRRVQQLRQGELSVRVGHLDVVSVPEPSSTSAWCAMTRPTAPTETEPRPVLAHGHGR